MADMLAEPFVLAPKLAPAIWGGSALVERYGKLGDPSARLGESWECFDANAISGSAETFAQRRQREGAALMGPIDANAPFPILTKIIDAREALSVQVHPTDAYAQRVEHQPVGKTECWVILEAQPGAELVLGWTRDTDRAEYERRVADGTLGELLRRVPVAPGDAFYLPAGTLHAIGAGIVLFETQQTSDLTYRIFDWNRVGADRKPRELHVAKAADVLDFRATFPSAIQQLAFHDCGAERIVAIADPRFIVERWSFDGVLQLETDARPVTITNGKQPITIAFAGGEVALAPWATAIVPAADASVSISGSGARILVARPQPDIVRLRASAAAAGIDGAAIDAFLQQFG